MAITWLSTLFQLRKSTLPVPPTAKSITARISSQPSSAAVECVCNPAASQSRFILLRSGRHLQGRSTQSCTPIAPNPRLELRPRLVCNSLSRSASHATHWHTGLGSASNAWLSCVQSHRWLPCPAPNVPIISSWRGCHWRFGKVTFRAWRLLRSM
jgi:hypothetical protein